MLFGSVWFCLPFWPSDSHSAVSGLFAQMLASLAVSNTRVFDVLMCSHDEPTGQCLSSTEQYRKAVAVTYVTILVDIVTDIFSTLIL